MYIWGLKSSLKTRLLASRVLANWRHAFTQGRTGLRMFGASRCQVNIFNIVNIKALSEYHLLCRKPAKAKQAKQHSGIQMGLLLARSFAADLDPSTSEKQWQALAHFRIQIPGAKEAREKHLDIECRSIQVRPDLSRLYSSSSNKRCDTRHANVSQGRVT